MDFDIHTLTREPARLQTTAKHQVAASSKPTFLKSLVLARGRAPGGTDGVVASAARILCRPRPV